MQNFKIGTFNGQPTCVVRDDGAFIPLDPANRDCVGFVGARRAATPMTDAQNIPVSYSTAALAALGLEGA